MSITPVGCSGHRAGEFGALGWLARVYSAIEPRAVPGAADHGAQPDSGEHPEFRLVDTRLSNLKTMLPRLMQATVAPSPQPLRKIRLSEPAR